MCDGSVDDVRREVRDRIRMLAPGGGYVDNTDVVFTADARHVAFVDAFTTGFWISLWGR